jgi:hypothetical protein
MRRLYIRMRVPDEFWWRQITSNLHWMSNSVSHIRWTVAMASMLAIVTMGTWRSVSTVKAQSTDYRGHHGGTTFLRSPFSTATNTSIRLRDTGQSSTGTSYDSYVGVAQALYKYMLRLVHTVWSRNSHMYGYSYDIIANNSTLVHKYREYDQHPVIWASSALWLMRNARLHWDLQKHVNLPPI